VLRQPEINDLKGYSLLTRISIFFPRYVGGRFSSTHKNEVLTMGKRQMSEVLFGNKAIIGAKPLSRIGEGAFKHFPASVKGRG